MSDYIKENPINKGEIMQKQSGRIGTEKIKELEPGSPIQICYPDVNKPLKKAVFLEMVDVGLSIPLAKVQLEDGTVQDLNVFWIFHP